jgi:trimeric autotransporter adhesin
LLAITPKQLTITGAVANNKTYDGNNTATVSGAMLVGAAFSDALTLVNGTVGTFDNENVGNSKVVTTNMTVTGAAIANYTQPVTPVLSANITPKALTATSVAAGKEYDGTTTAALTSALVGLVAGDDVTLTNGLVGTFASANAGTWAISHNVGITGADVPNYTFTAPDCCKCYNQQTSLL